MKTESGNESSQGNEERKWKGVETQIQIIEMII